ANKPLLLRCCMVILDLVWASGPKSFDTKMGQVHFDTLVGLISVEVSREMRKRIVCQLPKLFLVNYITSVFAGISNQSVVSAFARGFTRELLMHKSLQGSAFFGLIDSASSTSKGYSVCHFAHWRLLELCWEDAAVDSVQFLDWDLFHLNLQAKHQKGFTGAEDQAQNCFKIHNISEVCTWGRDMFKVYSKRNNDNQTRTSGKLPVPVNDMESSKA
ncbi:hypothetical protein CUMW_277310, partial [Citrus unshiu]